MHPPALQAPVKSFAALAAPLLAESWFVARLLARIRLLARMQRRMTRSRFARSACVRRLPLRQLARRRPMLRRRRRSRQVLRHGILRAYASVAMRQACASAFAGCAIEHVVLQRALLQQLFAVTAAELSTVVSFLSCRAESVFLARCLWGVLVVPSRAGRAVACAFGDCGWARVFARCPGTDAVGEQRRRGVARAATNAEQAPAAGEARQRRASPNGRRPGELSVSSGSFPPDGVTPTASAVRWCPNRSLRPAQ